LIDTIDGEPDQVCEEGRMEQMLETQRLIVAWRDGDMTSRDRLIARVMPELEQIAAARLRREHSSSLSTHDLVNEALIKLVGEHPEFGDRAHMLALVSRLMRNVLVDQARARQTDKRRHQKVELRTQVEGAIPQIDLLSLDSALIRLKAIDEGYADIVEMRYFGGMTVSDIAAVTGWSEPTIKRRWQAARAWLADAISQRLGDDD
jgi:RNA polymerase sigma factor (TIGR02999 family)